MKATLFSSYVDKYFQGIVGKIAEKYNDKSKEQDMLHKTMLTEEYTPDLRWGASSLSHSVVAADVVAFSSSLPLKLRGSLSSASGKVPKLGLKYSKDEDDINTINTMIARGTSERTIASKLFDDAAKVVKAIDVRKEIMFLQALSTGTSIVASESNDGTGVRVSFGYKEENTFKTTNAAWGAYVGKKTPQDDLQQLFDKAQEDGNAINHVYISKKYFNLFRKSDQGRLLAASFLNQVVVKVENLTVPSTSVFLEALSDEFGATFHIVNASYKYQKPDGTMETITPWESANIVGVPSDKVGRLVYGTLAEETNPVGGVSYQKAGTHILVSKYSKTDPLEEFTAGQAIVLPVIDGADAIYVLTADQASVIDLSVSEDAISFSKKAYTKSVSIMYGGEESVLTVKSSEEWATATLSKGKLSIKVEANSTESERTAEVTISDGDTLSVKVDVTQSA